MIFSPLDVISFQACKRRPFLYRNWAVNRRRPKQILDACLREGVIALSTGSSVALVRDEARARLMSEAAQPGMDLPEGVDPYVVASDLAALLDTCLTAISQLTLLSLHSLPPISLEGHAYAPLSVADDSGSLHRWLTVDVWDDDALTRELHSWVTAGDMAVCDAPMTLHVVVIGQRRNGRQQSPWCRAHEQPIIRRLRFLRKNHHHDGKGSERRPAIPPDWKTVWYSDMPSPDPEAWVAAMHRDEITPRLLLHPSIAEFTDAVRIQTIAQLSVIADEMERTSESLQSDTSPEPAMSLPMSRSACDGMVPCPYRWACYRPEPAEGIGEIGVYHPRSAAKTCSSVHQDSGYRRLASASPNISTT